MQSPRGCALPRLCWSRDRGTAFASVRRPSLSLLDHSLAPRKSTRLDHRKHNTRNYTMALQESRSRVLPTLWDHVYRRQFAEIDRMLAPGMMWEVFPAFYRPYFAPLPLEGVFDPHETVNYFKTIREKLLTEPKTFKMGEQRHGEESLTAHFRTEGIDANGKPFDVKHDVFVEFVPGEDKIKRGVEYLDSESLNLHMKRDANKQEWEERTPATSAVEGKAAQSTIEAGATPSASQGQSQSQAEQVKEPAASQTGQASQQKSSQA
ncbi:hypothetical protein NBRC10512_007734 [Rhodotorula toruloides]|nr:uncharacterized protein RHTO_04149 [Rhodotorula toruloides NP11]EMS19614.1 hypothetical protein RHTO_04149 [Rhodotorula toruloides NP11]KAJ8293945.1 hypothetical protein OF846_003195 [Rhodotorula toruloides]